MIFTVYAICIVYICLLVLSPERFTNYLPSFKVYPDNEKEAELLEQETKTRTYFDVSFFKKTNDSVSSVFHELLPQYSIGELNHEISKITMLIYLLKHIINRARPYQVNTNILLLESNTANTPSYPAGHACQAYYLAKYLGKKHPEKQDELNQIAQRCDMVRVKAGLHYPSDGVFSKQIIDSVI